jgi:hypothetical protein
VPGGCGAHRPSAPPQRPKARCTGGKTYRSRRQLANAVGAGCRAREAVSPQIGGTAPVRENVTYRRYLSVSSHQTTRYRYALQVPHREIPAPRVRAIKRKPPGPGAALLPMEPSRTSPSQLPPLTGPPGGSTPIAIRYCTNSSPPPPAALRGRLHGWLRANAQLLNSGFWHQGVLGRGSSKGSSFPTTAIISPSIATLRRPCVDSGSCRLHSGYSHGIQGKSPALVLVRLPAKRPPLNERISLQSSTSQPAPVRKQ